MAYDASISSGRGFAPAHREQTKQVNVGEAERVLSSLAGGALAYYGLSRGTFAGATLALLGASMVYRGVGGRCHLYDALGIDTAHKHNPATAVPAKAGVRVERSITIDRSPDEVYAYWRDLENLPRFMTHLESVKTHGRRSHWVAKAPLGMTVEWDAEIINESHGEMISWRSVSGSEIDTAGSVHFKALPGDRGTEITVNLKYNPPGGKLGVALAKLFSEQPEKQITEDLNHLKRLLETGEIPATASQASARKAR